MVQNYKTQPSCLKNIIYYTIYYTNKLVGFLFYIVNIFIYKLLFNKIFTKKLLIFYAIYDIIHLT